MVWWSRQRFVVWQVVLAVVVGFAISLTHPMQFAMPGLTGSYALLRLSDFIPLIVVGALTYSTRPKAAESSSVRLITALDVALATVVMGATYAVVVLLDAGGQSSPGVALRNVVVLWALARIVTFRLNIRVGLIAAAALPVLSGIVGMNQGVARWWAVPLAPPDALVTNAFVVALAVVAVFVRPSLSVVSQMMRS